VYAEGERSGNRSDTMVTGAREACQATPFGLHCSTAGCLARSITSRSGWPRDKMTWQTGRADDFQSTPRHSEADLYADDTTLTAVGNSVSEIESKLKDDVSRIDRWCKNN